MNNPIIIGSNGYVAAIDIMDGREIWRTKLISEVTAIVAQLPPVLERLTVVNFEKLLEQVPSLCKRFGRVTRRSNSLKF